MPNVLLFCENIFIIEAERTGLKIFAGRKYFQPLFVLQDIWSKKPKVVCTGIGAMKERLPA